MHSMITAQDYAAYTSEDHQVWSILYERQMNLLPALASPAFFEGIRRCGFEQHRIANFSEVNAELKKYTGFEVIAVTGLVPDKGFFEHLALRHFPAAIWIRTMEELDYIEAPDMFHDIYGHVPLLSNEAFADFLEGLARIAVKYVYDPTLTEMLARIYWFTVEFGLIQEPLGLRIYGAGILSSVAESPYSLGPVPERRPFDPQTIMATSFHKDRFQDLYYVINSYEQLFESLPEIERCLASVEQILKEKPRATLSPNDELAAIFGVPVRA